MYAMLQSILSAERTSSVPPGGFRGPRGLGGPGGRGEAGAAAPAGTMGTASTVRKVSAMRGPGAAGTSGTSRTAGPELAEALTALARGQTRRGLRVIISDFIDPGDRHATTPRWERQMRRLAARHQVLAVEIVDPRELELPDVGLVQMEDPETGVVREIVLSRRVQAAYAQAAAAQRARIKDALRRCGVPHLVLRTDRDWVSDVARFALRQRRVAGRPQGVRI
jgi:hypothetical protein